ncbi:MAG: formylglycine-generating enzyme family protein [Nitrosomonas sp.]
MDTKLLPPIFPTVWTSEWGEDELGLYLDLDYQNVTQRFRWIAPGTFLMGSPETQHAVTLTQGFWLADSACTQALWQAVMGENPAYFQDSLDHPVEYVNWDDVQSFIQALNTQLPDLHARLPTEAEWEYACRAGTTTPFSFGETITPEKVNYDPHAGVEIGRILGKTVPVKSLPSNPWGLYEMHGNVWEWCSDGYGDYPTEAVIDPFGPTTGQNRVLRGGSWRSSAWRTRSAYRHRDEPVNRINRFGFRLALGPDR